MADLNSMLEDLKLKLGMAELALLETPVGDLSSCNCGRTAREHIMDALNCLEAMIMIIEKHDPSMFVRIALQDGPGYLFYAETLNPDLPILMEEIDRLQSGRTEVIPDEPKLLAAPKEDLAEDPDVKHLKNGPFGDLFDDDEFQGRLNDLDN